MVLSHALSCVKELQDKQRNPCFAIQHWVSPLIGLLQLLHQIEDSVSILKRGNFTTQHRFPTTVFLSPLKPAFRSWDQQAVLLNKHEDLLGVGTVARLKRPVFISQKGKKIFFFTEPSGISLVHTQLAVQLVRFSLLEMKLPKGKFEHTSSLRRD